ncbi:hypothetical protein pb186bvf_020396 [Paramecium bursaria]
MLIKFINLIKWIKINYQKNQKNQKSRNSTIKFESIIFDIENLQFFVNQYNIL